MAIQESYRDFENGNEIGVAEASLVIDVLLNELGIKFDGRAIDVGFGTGHKSKRMRELGLEVFGIEPIAKRAKWASEQMGFIKPENVFNILAQDMPKEYFGTFDLVTMFKYRVIPNEEILLAEEMDLCIAAQINEAQLQVSKILAKLIKPDGTVIITLKNEFRDNYLYYPSHDFAPLMLQLRKIFQEVSYIDTSCHEFIFIVAKRPFPYEVIDQVSAGDISLLNLILKYKGLIAAWQYLLENECFYTGIHNPNNFVISERSLSYAPKK